MSKIGGWRHDGVFKIKKCVVCQTEFKPRSGVHKFCSEKCKGKWQYISGTHSTENQYNKINGNWDRYCARLLYCSGRKRDKLTKEIVLKKLKEQDYKCALSGIPLQCQLEKGVKNPYNASIDRIQAGGSYTEDNIQIICRALNHWRADTPLEDFVEFCRKVVEYQDQLKLGGSNGC